MEELRAEITQAHGTRSELLKWKLVVVGAIGSAGLGLAGAHTSKHADLVLAAVPLVCIYVDLLCQNLNIRMLVISSYFQTVQTEDPQQQTLRDYERFTERARNVFALEDWAIEWSTRVLSVAVLIYGIFGSRNHGAIAGAFITSGVIGVLGSFGAGFAYRRRRRDLRRRGSEGHGQSS